MFHLRPVEPDKSCKLVHVCRHAAHSADAGDQLRIPMAPLGCMPAGAGLKDALAGLSSSGSPGCLDYFCSSFTSTNPKLPMVGRVTLFPY
jgi:hypothetical protein